MASPLVPSLDAVTLRSTPLTHQGLALSEDGELAVAADDSVHILLPEFPIPDDPAYARHQKHHHDQHPGSGAGSSGVGRVSRDRDDAFKLRQYHGCRGQFMAIKKPNPLVNKHLFEAATGAPMADEGFEDEPYMGVGSGLPTGWGSSLNQTSAIEWSPVGLGFNLRPVLSVLLTNGSVMVYGEDVGFVGDMSTRERSFGSWRVLWGVGGILPLPKLGVKPDLKGKGQARDKTGVDGGSQRKDWHLPRDKIKSMSWARQVGTGRALLAYMNDDDEIIILTVQYGQVGIGKEDKEPTPAWKVEEVARFKNDGPHPKLSPWDPDFIPFGTTQALKWSPWLTSHDNNTKTAVLAHIDRSYVGFRRITIPANWKEGSGGSDTDVEVTIEPTDLMGICTNTLNDAFVEFEDAIWDAGPDGDDKVCRGVIASPFKATPFRVVINHADTPKPPTPHAFNGCGATYPMDGMSPDDTNPITGLIVHRPKTKNSPHQPSDPKSAASSEENQPPIFSLARLSATSGNKNWYQTNIPLPSDDAASSSPANDKSNDTTTPQWVTHVASTISLSVPVALASREAGSDSDNNSASGADEDDDYFDFDDMPDDACEQINPWRVRIWGLVASRGGGMTAALISQHSTLGPERRSKTKVMFGFRTGERRGPTLREGEGDQEERKRDADGGPEEREAPTTAGDHHQTAPSSLSAEARMWEWMYGSGSPVPGSIGDPRVPVGQQKLRPAFAAVINEQRCAFCRDELTDSGRYSKCNKGHSWATCAATGLAILAPGISRACAVCGLRTLSLEQIRKATVESGAAVVDAAVDESDVEACGGCGGKFIA